MSRRKQDSEIENQPNTKRQKTSCEDDCEDTIEQEPEWTTEEKEILLEELERKGWRCLEWSSLQERIKTKTEDQIKKLFMQLKIQKQAMESGAVAAKDTTPLQVWAEFANQVTDPSDTIAAQCIPQVLAVASLEERRYVDVSGNACPNFQQIYSFLANLLKGNVNIELLQPLDAMVILEFMDELETTLKYSYTDLQLEDVMIKYNALPKKTKDKLYQAVASSDPNYKPAASAPPRRDVASSSGTKTPNREDQPSPSKERTENDKSRPFKTAALPSDESATGTDEKTTSTPTEKSELSEKPTRNDSTVPANKGVSASPECSSLLEAKESTLPTVKGVADANKETTSSTVMKKTPETSTENHSTMPDNGDVSKSSELCTPSMSEGSSSSISENVARAGKASTSVLIEPLEKRTGKDPIATISSKPSTSSVKDISSCDAANKDMSALSENDSALSEKDTSPTALEVAALSEKDTSSIALKIAALSEKATSSTALEVAALSEKDTSSTAVEMSPHDKLEKIPCDKDVGDISQEKEMASSTTAVQDTSSTSAIKSNPPGSSSSKSVTSSDCTASKDPSNIQRGRRSKPITRNTPVVTESQPTVALRPLLPRKPRSDKKKQTPKPKASSLNPLKIPVSILSFKKKDNLPPGSRSTRYTRM